MTSAIPGGHRRIDRVLDESFVVGLQELSLDDLRARRRDAEQEEADLSYVRRMLQGRMDILRAELLRRAGGSEQSVVDHLSEILAEPSRATHGSGRFLTVEPSRVEEHRRAVEQVIADLGISDVEGHSDEEIRAALSRVEEFEHNVSEDRRQVQKVMDLLTAEVANRYRTGAASVEDLLAER